MTWENIECYFDDYCCALGQNIPEYIYEGILSFTCIGITLFILFSPNKRGLKLFSILMLVEYVCLLYSTTVLFREYNLNQEYNFTPFWSYVEIYKGNYTLQLPEKVMNLLAFVPIGILLGLAFPQIKWWRVVLMGLMVSASIEFLQFTLKRGFAEFDDVFHNTVGCLIGYLLCKSVYIAYRRIRI